MKKLIIKIYLRPVDTDLPHGASRALQSIIKADVVEGESTIQAASFFDNDDAFYLFFQKQNRKVRDDHLSPFGDLNKDEE